MARVRLNLSPDEIVRALRQGELPWTLNPASDFASDPGQWGASLINNAEVMVACLDVAGARSVAEIGAYAGDLTRYLLDWARGHDARVWAVDPSPQPELGSLDAEREDLTLVRATSHDALREMPLLDAYVIDGDHNYWTVSEEIRLITAQVSDGPAPLLLFHDVGWPHARRDDYYAPEQVPPEYRQPTVEGGGVFPGISDPRPGGLPYKWPADHEGGPRNGVLTAVEDYVNSDEKLRLVIVPAFFGLGVVWHADAAYAERLETLLAPLDRNPIIARLEANRTFHLAAVHHQMMEVAVAHQRLHRQEVALTRIMNSRGFKLTEALSWLRQRVGIARDAPPVSAAEIRRALEND
ncbi:MAG TPA: class I SAM-dependent methyltransferase [Solirubrobacteraceae bacterium]|jgi:hypothetical protein|nr:class I SAM-dependent methyltransferase [Solirubrobacteraceae bacterium]